MVSFDTGDQKLCLEGDAIKDQEGVDSDGTAVRHAAPHARTRRPPPRVTTSASSPSRTTGEVDGETKQQVVIYGAVVD